MKIENYAFVRVWNHNHKVSELTIETDNSRNPESSPYYVAIFGESYGREGFEDGKVIHTSAIKEITENGNVITFSGSVYELGKKHPDYISFEEALKKGLPIIHNWAVGSMYTESYADLELFLRGTYENGEVFKKRIVSQDGAIITAIDGSKAFIDWISIDEIQLDGLRCYAHRLKSRKFCHTFIEPDIFACGIRFWKIVGDGPYNKKIADAEGIL